MRVINVITTENGLIKDIESFGIFEEQLSDDVVEKAEEYFIEKVVSIRFNDTNTEEADNLRDKLISSIDDGFYEIHNSVVHLVYSEIN